MKYINLLGGVIFVVVEYATGVRGATLKDQSHNVFLNPPNIFRPTVRYWLPDASISTDVVEHDIEDLAKVGIGGFEFLPFYLYGLPSSGAIPPTDWNKFGYGTPAYKKVFNAAVEASERTQLLMSFALGANQGQGSPAQMESEGLAKELAYASVIVPSGSKFLGKLPLPPDRAPGEAGVDSFMHATEHRIEQKLIAVVAARIERTVESSYSVKSQNLSIPVNNTYLEEDSLTVITSKVIGGRLNFEPRTQGCWQIFAFYERFTNQKSCTGAPVPEGIIGNGSWIVDHFSELGAQVTTTFIDENVLDKRNQKALSKIGQYAWEDSMEMYAHAWWTSDLLTTFRLKRGYDLTKFLPLIFNGENSWAQLSPPYLNQMFLGVGSDGGQGVNDDYRTTLTELNQKYNKYLQDWAHRKGLKFSNQPAYNLPLDMADTISLIDTPETESLGFPTIDMLRQFTGPAHMSLKSIISSETGALTQNATAYSQTMPELLTFVNEQLVAGVNMFVLHGTPYSGEYEQTTWPAYTAFFYNVPEMHSKCQPAWSSYKYSMDYIARNSFISQTAATRIDLAFLLSSKAFTFPAIDPASLSSAGFSYEYISPSNLDLKTSKIQNKLLSPEGPAFKALIVDGDSSYPYQLASKLESYAKSGFPIIFLKGVPSNLSGLCRSPCDPKDFQARLNKLLTKYPKTVSISSSIRTLGRSLLDIGVEPRVSFTNGSWFHTMWKSSPDSKADYVYFYNPNVSGEASFRVEFLETRYPFKFDAWTGRSSPIVTFKRSGNNISMTINLSKGATTIIAFAKYRVFNGQSSPKFAISNVGTNVLGFTSQDGGITAQLVGNSSVTLSCGKEVTIQAKTSAPLPLKVWNITIEDWHPTSNLSSMVTEVTNHSILDTELKPWTDYNLPNVSGIAHYTTSFSLSATDAILSLGPIQNTVKPT